MTDSNKTKEQLLNELTDLREKVVELEDVKNSLQNLEEKYRSLFENAPICLATFNLKGVITSCNNAWLKISGYTREEIVGKHFSKLKFISLKNLPEYFKMFTSLLSGKDIKPFTGSYFLKDGNMLYLRVHFGRIKEKGRIVGYNVMTIDITERQKVFQKLKESEDKYRNLFENMPGVYYRIDKKGNLLMINPAGVKLFGYENEEEILGKNVAQSFYFDPEEREKYLKKLKNHKGTLSETELIFKKKNGDPVIVSDTSHFYYDKEGKITGTEGNFIDITERKKNEQIQKVLYNISKAANSSISLDQLYPVIHKELGTIIDTTNFYIAILDQEKDKIYFPYHVDEMDDDFETQSIKDKSLTCYVINHKNSLLLNYDTIQKLHKQGELLNPGVVTKDIFWFGVPLKVEDKIIGAMAVQSYNNPNLYSEKDTTLLEFVSSQVATVIERKQTEEKVKHLSFHDSLTGIYNRAYFMEELKRLNFPRYYPLSIVSIDINGLKFINDTFGHSEGDKLLRHFAVILKSVSRKGDILARVG
ncbi:MAG: PAS domain S-box protein, partial [Candidatus Caldatribacteriota bacterium]|nr:PAS domain S-box protein [Candidatus Caldatribacteriota bacterium]